MNAGTVLVGGVVSFLIWAALVVGILFVAGSAVTSGVKSLSHECGTRYGIEEVVRGDWFCPARQ